MKLHLHDGEEAVAAVDLQRGEGGARHRRKVRVQIGRQLTVPKEVMPTLSFRMTCSDVTNKQRTKTEVESSGLRTLLPPRPATSIATIPPFGCPNA
jgi:hypothetical protein